MFSVRELTSRYRKWPLAWVLGPLMLGALIVAAIAIVLRASMGFPNDQLALDIRRAAATGPEATYLRQVTDRHWDRVCVFPPFTPKQHVDDVLGIDWSRAGGYPDNTHLLLVFVSDHQVLTHTYVERSLLELPDSGGECHGPRDEATRIREPRGDRQ